MTLSTSKNLTILGILTILGGLTNAGIQYLQSKTIDFNVLLLTISAGIGMIMGKGSASTGGTVDGAGAPVVPVVPVPLKPAP
jgi:hypothetical protein